MLATQNTVPKIKVLIKENGCGDYNLKDSFVVGEIIISPRTYGKPQHIEKMTKTNKMESTIFIR